MSKITIYIDEHPIQCDEGEYILQVARKNDIFIPAICYLSECSPTLACKLCMVEADGKRVYSCNAKTKDGMKILTNTPEIAIERKAIMSVYDINHPLECGVCDKSGECELQNYSLMMGVDHQEYAVKDSYKKKAEWGHALYDPNLCIVCERCITACKDRVGNASLKTVKRDADAPDKAYKETMPKDAFGVWNKMSKSLIGFVGSRDCEDCGECISVCPVGALGEDHFHYASNAWELDKISSSCPHCPLGCELTYEGKHGKVYRVSNDWNFGSLCGAGRYGYEIPIKNADREMQSFTDTLEAFKYAQTISFGNFITNEEAYILNMLKQHQGYRLYNPTALEYQKFLKAFMSGTGQFYKGNMDTLGQSDCIITLGGSIRHDVPVLKYKINNSLKMIKGSSLTTFHPLKDTALSDLSKNVQHFSYKAGDEEHVVFLLMQMLCADPSSLPESLAQYLNAQQDKIQEEKITTKTEGDQKIEEKEIVQIDRSLIATYLGFGLQEILTFKERVSKSQKITLIVGSDLYHHPKSLNMAKVLAFLDKMEHVNVMLLPPEGNALGVALLCDLDEEKEGFTIGYNKEGDYVLSSLLDTDHQQQKKAKHIIMPSLWQQFGSMTTLDKKVVPLLPAYEYDGFDLSDFAEQLCGYAAFKQRNVKRDLQDYTMMLPVKKGYLPFELSDLLSKSGYMLSLKIDQDFWEGFDGKEVNIPQPNQISIAADRVLCYGRDAESQFSLWSYSSSLLRSQSGVYLSKQLLEKLQLEHGMQVEITNDRGTFTTMAYLDETLEGEIAALSLGIFMRDEHPIFESGSRFATATIQSMRLREE